MRSQSSVLSVAGEIGDDPALSSTTFKRSEIERTGASDAPDFVLSVGAGVELCREGATFGVAADRPDDNVLAVNLTYRGLEGRTGSANFGGGETIRPGEEITVETGAGPIVVGYQ